MSIPGFIKYNRDNKEVGYILSKMYHSPVTFGEVGIEVEVEGNKFPKDGHSSIPSEWTYHHDGSLRGVDNAEYVLTRPIKFEQVPDAVDRLWEMFNNYGSVLDVSNRTSVHVHVNVSSFTINRLASFAALYFMLEELLVAWCGPHREGNLFCLRAIDAPNIVTQLRKFIKRNEAMDFNNGLHYAAFNIQAIQKLRSVEIRSMRGATTPEEVKDWVSIIEQLYRKSAEFPDPRTVCSNFSGRGAVEFIEEILEGKTGLLLNGLQWSSSQLYEALYRGIRIAQDICYARNWDNFVPEEIKIDPFGRTMGHTRVSTETSYLQQLIASSATLSQWQDSPINTLPTEPIHSLNEEDDDDTYQEDVDYYNEQEEMDEPEF